MISTSGDLLQCASCKGKQTNTHGHNIHRVRRSNSCPSNDLTPFTKANTNSSKSSKSVTMVKKWHSLQTVHYNDNSTSQSVPVESDPNVITCTTSESSMQQNPVW